MIELQKVSKLFGALCVLDNVSLTVEPGETLCIIGDRKSVV